MKFVSTRNPREPVDFTQALLGGLAPDGGLYRPMDPPDLTEFYSSLSPRTSFSNLAAGLTGALLQPEITAETAREITDKAFSFEPKLVEPVPGIYVLELFHGPSCAFKDFGASFLASAMDRLLADRNERAVIVTATSGDTGSAVAQAFHGRGRIDVVILYPSGRVSPLQEKQLTTLGGNVTALEVDGSFDDCQRMAKTALTDPSLASLPLSSANSINPGRLLPQSFYYVWAWQQMKSDFAFVVPSGNFGNITAGLYAAAWGMPVSRFVAATNDNDVVPEYLRTGTYSPRPSVATYSNAMDVGSPSNYERLDVLYESNVDIFRRHLEAVGIDDQTTIDVMKRVRKDHNYLCCPHTAVGWKAAELYRKDHPDIPTVVLSTAHPAKFVEVVEKATGRRPALPPALASLMDKEKQSVRISSTDAALRNWLLGRFI